MIAWAEKSCAMISSSDSEIMGIGMDTSHDTGLSAYIVLVGGFVAVGTTGPERESRRGEA